MSAEESLGELASSEAQREPQPRSTASIIPIGLLLGPGAVMLWLGRGRLAILYFVLQFAVATALFLPAILELAAPIAIRGIGLSNLFALLQLPLSTIAIAHAIWLRRSAARPWFSRWFIALPLPIAT